MNKGQEFKIFVQGFKGEKYGISVNENDLIATLKQNIKHKLGIEDDQDLVILYNGLFLEEEDEEISLSNKISDYDIGPGVRIDVYSLEKRECKCKGCNLKNCNEHRQIDNQIIEEKEDEKEDNKEIIDTESKTKTNNEGNNENKNDELNLNLDLNESDKIENSKTDLKLVSNKEIDSQINNDLQKNYTSSKINLNFNSDEDNKNKSNESNQNSNENKLNEELREDQKIIGEKSDNKEIINTENEIKNNNKKDNENKDDKLNQNLDLNTGGLDSKNGDKKDSSLIDNDPQKQIKINNEKNESKSEIIENLSIEKTEKKITNANCPVNLNSNVGSDRKNSDRKNIENSSLISNSEDNNGFKERFDFNLKTSEKEYFRYDEFGCFFKQNMSLRSRLWFSFKLIFCFAFAGKYPVSGKESKLRSKTKYKIIRLFIATLLIINLPMLGVGIAFLYLSILLKLAITMTAIGVFLFVMFIASCFFISTELDSRISSKQPEVLEKYPDGYELGDPVIPIMLDHSKENIIS